jgi:hypothetical protein
VDTGPIQSDDEFYRLGDIKDIINHLLHLFHDHSDCFGGNGTEAG